MTKIVVITITYNDPTGFKQTGESFAAQKNYNPDDVKWLVINGNPYNQETTAQIKNFSNLVHWSQSEYDEGIYDAMNIGIEKAKEIELENNDGPYWYVFMNGGDKFADPNVLNKLITAVDTDPAADFMYGDTLFNTNENEYGIGLRKPLPFNKKPLCMPTSHQSMLFRSDVIGDLRYSKKYKIASDYKFYLDYAEKIQHPLYVESAIAHYRGGGVSDYCPLRSNLESSVIRQSAKVLSFKENAKMILPVAASLILQRVAPKIVHHFIRNIYRLFKAPDESHLHLDEPVFNEAPVSPQMLSQPRPAA